MSKVRIEADGEGGYFIRDGRGLVEAVPVVIIGQVEPDERVAGDHGDGVNLTTPVVEDSAADILAALTEETYVAEVIITADGSGNSVDEIIPAPGAGSLVVKSLRVLGTNKAGATFSFDFPTARVLKGDEIAKGRDSAKIRITQAATTALTCTTAGATAAAKYAVEATWTVVT